VSPAGGPLVLAAGALPWRERDGRLEVALIHRPRYQDWSWPKGKLDPGESVPGAACREVAEETGAPVVLGVPLPGIRYRTADGARKQVHYWAARPAGPDDDAPLAARRPVHPAAPTEVDDVAWVPVRAAADLLTRRADRAPLEVATRALVVARHGKAVGRAAWHGDEATRPLTGRGEAQARALVEVLAAFGVREAATSPWARCSRTLTPYADAAGLAPRAVDALTEAAVHADPAAAARVVADLLAGAPDAVVCTHRPALATVLGVLADATRRWTLGSLPEADPWLRPGEALVAHVAGTGERARVVAVERHRPPQGADEPEEAEASAVSR
jgi:8-oxo-dGTP pyrophosphatase MutT (NUDIX family)/phosphohistidine phosphatase SixA